MCSYKDIKSRSASEEEIVVSYNDAMELLCIFEQDATQILGWEGWIQYLDGSLGHSQKYQGTGDLSSMLKASAIALAKSTIMQAHTEWEGKPEVSNADLLYCITINT